MRYTVPLEVALLVLGVGALIVALYAWTTRNEFAKKRREEFEKVGWTWFVHLVSNEELLRRVGMFFGIFWGVIAAALLISAVVLLIIPG